MSRRRHSVDQIIGKLRQADVELGTRGRPSRKPAAVWRSPCRPTTAGVRSTAACSRQWPSKCNSFRLSDCRLRMKYIGISILCILLLAVSAFCGFGFLATFEPLENPAAGIVFRIGYGVIGSAAILAIVLLIVRACRLHKRPVAAAESAMPEQTDR